MRGQVDGRAVALGNQRLLESLNVDPGPLAERAERQRAEGETVMFVAVDGKPAGLVCVADPIKETTAEALDALRADGLRIVMLTGDNRTTAEAVARKVGIEEIHAEVLPEHKNEVIRRLREEGRVVAMAGDGINDAPALAQADVGIAMGTGADVAMESAGITLVKGDLRGLVRARRLSEATMRNIKQNLFFAFVYNALGVPVAAGVLYPFMAAAEPDHRRRGDEPLLGVGDRQRAAPARRAAVVRGSTMTLRIWLVIIAALSLSGSAFAAGETPYAGWDGRAIKALSAEQIDDLRSGRGMGLALPAELNGYPGPRHVLDLADQLELTAGQQAEAQQLYDAMQAQAVVLGEQVLAGEAALDRLFALGMASDAAIDAAAVEVGRLQGALRGHHLRYHAAMRAILSPHQVMRYQELRGYAAEGAHGHGAHGDMGHAR